MKTTVLNHKDGSKDPIEGSFELELADLKLNFGTPSFATTADLKGRSFALLQLRAKNAVRALLRSKDENLLLLCASSRVDQLKLAADLVQEISGREPCIAYAPTRFELFGTKEDPGLASTDYIIVMPCTHLCDHPKWLGMLDACLAQNKAMKLILCGDSADCADLAMIWPSLDNALHADVVLEFPAQGSINLMAELLASYMQELQVKPFDLPAVQLFCLWAARQSGDKRWIGIPELKLKSLVGEADFYAKGSVIGVKQVLKAIAATDFRVNYLAESELREHRDRQLLIATQGAEIGQINGLSVVETYGSNYEFGEPVRITATLRAGGEGDVIDIERKAELAGQIHAKAMMIINGYLTKEFGSEQPLPVSASLVFEQSYSEVDGDSASLTGLCAVLSCLAGVPIRQDLAVTGAVDQFGHVQPVGGVNEKIEGFFRVCRLHGLSGSQGVVIPESCVNQLVLRPAVEKAIAEGRFHIYTVNHVTQAIKLLTTVPWGNKEQEGSICQRIVSRLENISMNGHSDRPWWKFWGD